MKKIRAIEVSGDEVYLNPHHFDVLRLRNGDLVIALLPSGDFAKVEVIDVERKTGRIVEVIGAEIPPKRVCVGLSILKKSKNETQVEFLSLIGVDAIIPLMTSRVDFSIPIDKMKKVRERLQKIALESARISGVKPPVIHDITPLERINQISEQYEEKIVFWEGAEKILSHDDIINTNSIIFVVGPEGGFSEHDIKLLERYGFEPRSLGQRILTAEFFPIYFLSALDFISRFTQSRLS